MPLPVVCIGNLCAYFRYGLLVFSCTYNMSERKADGFNAMLRTGKLLTEHTDIFRVRTAAAAQEGSAGLVQRFHMEGKFFRPHTVNGLPRLRNLRHPGVGLGNHGDRDALPDSGNHGFQLIRTHGAVAADGVCAYGLQGFQGVIDIAAKEQASVGFYGQTAWFPLSEDPHRPQPDRRSALYRLQKGYCRASRP